MITAFDKPTLGKLQADLQQVLSQFAAERGLRVETTGGRFDGTTFLPKIEFTVTQLPDGRDVERALFERDARLVGLQPDHYKRRILGRDGEYEIVGLDLGRSRFPVKGRHVATGKVMLFTVQSVLGAKHG